MRWDGGYAEGDTISQYYDNLHRQARRVGTRPRPRAHRMLRALGEFEIEGVAHHDPRARRAARRTPTSQRPTHSTKWVEDEVDRVGVRRRAGTDVAATAAGEEPSELVERTVPVEVDGRRFSVRLWLPDAPGWRAAHVGARSRPAAGRDAAPAAAGNGTITAPMQGTIVKVLVARRRRRRGRPGVLVLEAMKMENHINAETAGTVAEVRVRRGDTVGTGDVLVVIE